VFTSTKEATVVKRLSTGMLAALIAAFCGLSAGLAQTGAPPPADFDSPPSGQIPSLYNDRHVYSRPDVLKQGRVLAALVKGSTLLIPLRSMFEQTGATVLVPVRVITVHSGDAAAQPGSAVLSSLAVRLSCRTLGEETISCLSFS
jgi:hypothetical protein